MFIRVVDVPPGEAPEEVRRAWVGMELPLVAGETGPRPAIGGGVLSGPRNLPAALFAWLTGGLHRYYGYVVDAPQALALLAEKAPGAAQWWRECAPRFWQPGRRFIFSAVVCVEVAEGPVLSLREPAPPPSQQIIAAPPSLPSPQGVTESPTPPVRLGLGVPFRRSAAPNRLRLAVQECVGWIVCGSAVLFALGYLSVRWYSSIGLQIFIFLMGAAYVWGTRALRRKADLQDEPLPLSPGETRGAAEAFHLPEGTAKSVDDAPMPPTFTFEGRNGACPVEPTLAEPRSSWGYGQLVQRSSERLEVVPNPSTWVVGLLMGLGAPAAWVVTILFLSGSSLPAHPEFETTYILLPILQIVAIAVATQSVALLTRRVVLDRAAGEVWLHWFFQQTAACRLAEVVAVQVVGLPRGRDPLYQVNLVFGDPEKPRFNVVNHRYMDRRGHEALEVGRRLAVFLGKPLVDQVEAMAVLDPAPLTGLLVPDGLAGFHNTKLIDYGDGVLELRPIAPKGGIVLDSWTGTLFRRACASVRFDRNRGRRPRLFVRMLAGDGLPRLPDAWRKPLSLPDVTAVDLAPELISAVPFGETASRRTCRLLLRLRDADHPQLELAPHAEEAWARETGERLARFIGVALEDRIRPDGA